MSARGSASTRGSTRSRPRSWRRSCRVSMPTMPAGRQSPRAMMRVLPGCRWTCRRAGRNATHVFHQYVIRVGDADRDRLREHLRRARDRHRHSLSGPGASAAGLSGPARRVPCRSSRNDAHRRPHPEPADVPAAFGRLGRAGHRGNPRLLRLTAAADQHNPHREHDAKPQQQPADQPFRRNQLARLARTRRPAPWRARSRSRRAPRRSRTRPRRPGTRIFPPCRCGR